MQYMRFVYIYSLIIWLIGLINPLISYSQSPDQPVLLIPTNGENVLSLAPVFSWTSPGSLNEQQTPSYAIQIVEIIGDQSPVAAIQSNPDLVQENAIRDNIFSFPAYAQSLQAGKKYAWQVSTKEKRGVGEGESNATIKSEVFWFTYKDISKFNPSCLGVMSLSTASSPKKYSSTNGELYICLDSVPDLLRSTLRYSIEDFQGKVLPSGPITPTPVQDQVFVFDLRAVQSLRVKSARDKLFTLKAKAGNGEEYRILFFNK
jgi:hypothetical protein